MIGNDLYVHAGLGKDFYDKNLSIPTVNEEMSKGLFMTKKNVKSFLHSQPSYMETRAHLVSRTGTHRCQIQSAGKRLPRNAYGPL